MCGMVGTPSVDWPVLVSLMPFNAAHPLFLRLVAVFRFAAVQELEEKAKLLRKEARGVQHMVKKDEVKVHVPGCCPSPPGASAEKVGCFLWCLFRYCTVSASALCFGKGRWMGQACVALGRLRRICVE